MGGGMGPEQGDEQFLGNQGVQPDSILQVLGEAVMAFQGEQGPDAAPGQGFRRGADLFGGLRELLSTRGQGFFPHPAQQPADIGLEQDDDDEDKALDDDIQEPFQGEELQPAGHQISQEQKNEPGQDLDGPGAFQG